MVYWSSRRLTLDTEILFNSTYLQRCIKLYALLLFQRHQIARWNVVYGWLITSYLGTLHPRLLFCWKLFQIHKFLKPQATLWIPVISNLIFFWHNSDIVIIMVFIFSMKMFSFQLFLDVHEIDQGTLLLARSNYICMYVVLFAIFIEIVGGYSYLLCFGHLVENFIIVKKVLLEFWNLWRYYLL